MVHGFVPSQSHHHEVGKLRSCEFLDLAPIPRCVVQTKGMHTIIRDENTTADNFVFYTDRLLRLVMSCFAS